MQLCRGKFWMRCSWQGNSQPHLGGMAFVSIGAIVVTLLAGGFLGGAAWHHTRLRFLAWLEQPRESRWDRRARLASCFAECAMEYSISGSPREALYWAWRAVRRDPAALDALNAMGRALLGLERFKEALVYFERAYRLTTECVAPNQGLFRGEAAHGVAACHGHLARRARSQDERERHDMDALSWLRTAIECEPTIAENLDTEAAFVHLRVQVQCVTSDVLGREGSLLGS